MLISHYCFTQTLGQDAQGFSAIVVPTTTFNLDIANNVGTFSLYQNFLKKQKDENLPVLLNCRFNIDPQKCLSDIIPDSYPTRHFWTWGLDLKGDTKDGIGTLFSEENVASSASLGAMIGYNISHTSHRENAAKNIADAYALVNNADENIIKKIKEIDQKLIVNVALQTGMTPTALTPPSFSTNTKEQINFYNAMIERLSNQENTKSKNDEKIESKLKRKTNLIILAQAVDSTLPVLQRLKDAQKLETVKMEIAKVTKRKTYLTLKPAIASADAEIAALEQEKILLTKNPQENQDTLKTEIYNKYYAVKGLISIEYPADSFSNLFDKSEWDTKRTKIGQDLFITTAEAEKLKSQQTDSEEIKELINNYKSLRDLAKKKDEIEKDHVNKVINQNISFVNHLIYFRGTTKGTDYIYDLANDSTKVSDRFKERHFNGYNLELGYTANFRKFNFIGLSTSVNYTNNIYALTPTTFKLEKSDPDITDGALKTSEEIKALSGTFDAFLRYDLNFDYVHLIPLKENPDNTDGKASVLYVSLNPYIRHRIYEKSDTLKNNTVLGIGLHTYSSKDNKIMGGLFIQTNDLFGVHTDEQSTLGKRISFGIIAKYAITGLKLEEKK